MGIRIGEEDLAIRSNAQILAPHTRNLTVTVPNTPGNFRERPVSYIQQPLPMPCLKQWMANAGGRPAPHAIPEKTLSPPDSMTGDQALIEAFQSGDEFAFVSIYNRYKGSVYAFCLKMLGDRELAADVMQDTFLRLYENRERLIKSSSFRSWLFTIARNQCLNTMRKGKRMVAFGDSVPEPTADSTPVSRLEKNERIAVIGAYLLRLSPDYREVLILREYQNLSYEEIAAVTRSTVSSVKSRLFKARRKLAVILGPVMDGSDLDEESVVPVSGRRVQS